MTKASKERNERREQANANDKTVVKVITVKSKLGDAINFEGQVDYKRDGDNIIVFEKGKEVGSFHQPSMTLISFRAV